MWNIWVLREEDNSNKPGAEGGIVIQSFKGENFTEATQSQPKLTKISIRDILDIRDNFIINNTLTPIYANRV